MGEIPCEDRYAPGCRRALCPLWWIFMANLPLHLFLDYQLTTARSTDRVFLSSPRFTTCTLRTLDGENMQNRVRSERWLASMAASLLVRLRCRCLRCASALPCSNLAVSGWPARLGRPSYRHQRVGVLRLLALAPIPGRLHAEPRVEGHDQLAQVGDRGGDERPSDDDLEPEEALGDGQPRDRRVNVARKTVQVHGRQGKEWEAEGEGHYDLELDLVCHVEVPYQRPR